MIPYSKRLFLEKKAKKTKPRKRIKRKEENNEGENVNPNMDKINTNGPYKKRTFVFPPKWGMGEGQYLTPNVSTFTEMMDMVVGYNRGANKKIVIVYPGSFTPFHREHTKIVNKLKSSHPRAEVFIATTNDRHFTYEDKQRTALASGTDPKMFVKTAKLFQVPEIVNKFSRENTILIFALTKNVIQDKIKFNKYVKPFESVDECKPISENIYIMPVSSVSPNSSAIREKYKSADENGRKQIIIDLYGSYKPDLHKLFNQKF